MTALARWYRSLHHLERVALILWVIAVVGVVGRVAVAPTTGPQSGSVVPIYLKAAQRWLAGDDPYAPCFDPPLDVYRNPPGVAAAFVPLTLVGPRAAGIVWRLVSAAVFLLGLRNWLRAAFPVALTPARRGAAFALALPLALMSLNNGQTNLLLIGCLLHGSAAVAADRGRAGGFWLAAAAALKVYPAAVGMLLAVAFPRRVLPAFVAGCVALVAAPYLFQHADYVSATYRNFAAHVGSDNRGMEELRRSSRDLFLLLRVWAAPPSPSLYAGIVLGVAAGMAGLVAWRRRRGDAPATVAGLAFDLGCVWMTVFGPASEASTYTLLAPTAATAVVAAHATRRAGRLRFALAVLGWTMVMSPVVRDMFPNGWRFHVGGPMPAGGLLLTGAVLLGVRQGDKERGRQGDEPLPSPGLPLSLSPCLPLSLSPRPFSPLSSSAQPP